ncbi:uncharacterized protein PHALS_07368 [Plasmopara halstedii]|uniref:Uncharacterized protein n=1 Tax=Plasmopara halstedii TaxID=4781 RepID=A0A0P1B4A5_PLAHL|nr:uncharacterized protein PHALS_07368 [Plasmopara halstedii]CEG49612.1 hypothetical protein PHALS_07368 [Plasmopara halstedii]|eukprot:XP_024585981.1 hypothetical protein PHALS_07368 [Plasmopara halstedii]
MPNTDCTVQIRLNSLDQSSYTPALGHPGIHRDQKECHSVTLQANELAVRKACTPQREEENKSSLQCTSRAPSMFSTHNINSNSIRASSWYLTTPVHDDFSLSRVHRVALSATDRISNL